MADLPVGYWRLGDHGGTARDETATNTGTYLLDGYTQDEPGALVCDPDTSVRFLGAGALIRMGENVHEVAPISLEAWITPQATDGVNRYVISKAFSDTNGATGYALYIHDMSILSFVVALNGQQVSVSTVRFDFGNWSYGVATLDGADACLYVNGVLVEACTRAVVSLQATTEPFKIGAYDESGFGAFIGTIDEVAIYDVALTDDQILVHWQTGIKTQP